MDAQQIKQPTEMIFEMKQPYKDNNASWYIKETGITVVLTVLTNKSADTEQLKIDILNSKDKLTHTERVNDEETAEDRLFDMVNEDEDIFESVTQFTRDHFDAVYSHDSKFSEVK